MKIEKALNVLIRYIDKNIVPHMNSLQQVGYSTIAETLRSGSASLSEYLSKNFFLRMLLAIDEGGNINADRLISSLRRVISKNGFIEFDVPMYGKFIIKNEDINEIARFMMEENNDEGNT